MLGLIYLPCLLLILAAAGLAWNGSDHWGWFLFAAVFCLPEVRHSRRQRPEGP